MPLCMFRTWTEPDIYPESAAWFLGPKVNGKYCSLNDIYSRITSYGKGFTNS